MRRPVNQSADSVKARPYRPRRSALNWVDFLVIAATVMTFLAVLAINGPRSARAQNHADLVPQSELPVQLGNLPVEPGLLKARIGLATTPHWS